MARDEVVPRLLVSKQLLETAGQLTPDSEPVEVARAILSAHDAAELCLAAIADEVRVPGLRGEAFLLTYASALAKHPHSARELAGMGYLRQLNDARVGFKHLGNLPNVQQWYRVIEKVWTYIDQWCQEYLGMPLSGLGLEQLLRKQEVKDGYLRALRLADEGRYQQALEEIAKTLFLALEDCPGVAYPTFGARNADQALMLTAFGVRPTQYISLVEFLPRVWRLGTQGELRLEWITRETGHPANWSEGAVRFCLGALLDTALKVQHAAPMPIPIHYRWVYDDLLTAGPNGAELWNTTRPRPFSTNLAPGRAGSSSSSHLVRR